MGKLLNLTQENFTIVQNCIFMDSRLSFHAKGVLCTLLSLPNGWNFSVRGLAALVSHKDSENEKPTHARGDGIDGINLSVQLLEKLGYLRRVRSQGDGGKFDGFDYLLSIPPEPPVQSTITGITVDG